MQGYTWLPSELGASLGYKRPCLIELLLPEDQRGKGPSKAISTPYVPCVTRAGPVPFTQQTSHQPSHFLNKGKRPTGIEVCRVLRTQASLSRKRCRRRT